jgi:hypothetical protein
MTNNIPQNNNLYSISSDNVKVDEQDKRCAPGKTFEYGSCIRLEILIKCAEAYNEEFPGNAIELDSKKENLHPNKYKKYLVKEFNQRLEQKCSTQKCWTQQNFIKRIPKIAQEELEKYTFRPDGPDEGNKWLNTDHIDSSMSQYEIKYPDFKYIGSLPRDFQNHNMFRKDEKSYKQLWNGGKTKIGIVFNTDSVGQSGEHWNALYADFDKGEIYFFYSYGVAPNKEVQNHMKLLEQFIRTNCSEMTRVNRNKNNLMKCDTIKTNHNKERHQKKGSECGVYSMNFILRMLRGDKFDQICKSKVDDDTINKCRKVYFTKESND